VHEYMCGMCVKESVCIVCSVYVWCVCVCVCVCVYVCVREREREREYVWCMFVCGVYMRECMCYMCRVYVCMGVFVWYVCICMYVGINVVWCVCLCVWWVFAYKAIHIPRCICEDQRTTLYVSVLSSYLTLRQSLS
jgi:hypothetical protein